MKRIIVLLLVLISCKSHQSDIITKSSKIDLTTKIQARVYKIDSINNYYLIYVSSEKLNYKIISENTSHEYCNQVLIDSIYTFQVESLILPPPKLNKESELSRPINYLDFKRCIHLSDNTEICTEVRVQDLLKSKNLLGLCYRKFVN